MTLNELSMVLGKDLVVSPRAGIGDFMASLRGVETKERPTDGCLTGEYGYARTITGAIEHYAKLISGKYIVSNAYGEGRIEMKLGTITFGATDET